MEWINFPVYAISVIILWTTGIFLYLIPNPGKNRLRIANFIVSAGILVLSVFISILWIKLERPPLRTLGETRLWYSFFLPLIGIITYIRWQYHWFISYSLGMAILFLLINVFHPENYSKTLMPALQSPWFVPHVIVYIFAYALLAASSLVALKGLYQRNFKKFEIKTIHLADNLVYIGFSFLTLGLIFGALWAKEAWGHYWTWDPKETWAFLTWIMYLIYIHLRYRHKQNYRVHLWMLTLSFVVLLIAWFGINYLATGANSVHTYG